MKSRRASIAVLAASERLFSSGSMPPPLPLVAPVMCIWGSNTGVGKTLVSAGMAAAAMRTVKNLLYLKPLQTGFPVDSDARLVARVLQMEASSGPHASALLPVDVRSPTAVASHPSALLKTLFAWKSAVSPHLAVEYEGRGVADSDVVAAIRQEMADFSGRGADAVTLIETAGGVASPGPSGTLQCDLLRPLRLPCLLVGDGRLGGISATLAAYELLVLRGYTVPFITLMEPEGLNNWKAIQQHVDRSTAVLPLSFCRPADGPPSPPSAVDSNLAQWLEENAPQFDQLLSMAAAHHMEKVCALEHAAQQAQQVLWWPFTQHGSIGGRGGAPVTTIDSRAGEHFAVLDSTIADQQVPALQELYDGCASWWTQGVSAEAVPPMARAVGHALSRYGHVIFPQNVHEPALQLAHRALELVGGDWASRVFFTDNGSTAIEVALKMAFRKYMVDHGILEDDSGVQLEVLGLADAYHGDTLGAMDAVAPSPYNGRKQTPWFTGRGLFLDAPTVGLQGGDWKVMLPDDMLAGSGAETVKTAVFKSLDDVFSNASAAPRAEFYRQQIEARMQQHLANNPATALGACIMEPVLQGAGGMQLIDPEFQRAMAAVCKAHGIPLIVDEVFTGFWRLGHPSGASLLGITPDIACYAKLLTGGVVPMALTLATDAVFRSFEGNSKAYALLHGHSYTAHPVGCSAALQALATFTDPGVNANLCSPGAQGRCQNGNQCTTSCSRLLPLWDEERVQQLSRKEGVERIVALGTVLAVELKASATGYTSNAAVGVVAELRQRGVFTRPLGNVVYVMVTPMTSRKQCNVLLTALEKSLEAAS